MADHMRTELVLDALDMAIATRELVGPLIAPTDRGSQYAATHTGKGSRNVAQDHTCTASMSRKANCWDNAVAESYFDTLKCELIHRYR